MLDSQDYHSIWIQMQIRSELGSFALRAFPLHNDDSMSRKRDVKVLIPTNLCFQFQLRARRAEPTTQRGLETEYELADIDSAD
jgi:hypothetical protein